MPILYDYSKTTSVAATSISQVRIVAGGGGAAANGSTLNLPTPISSVSVVPFAYSGVSGNSIFMAPINWTDFEPRFGLAYVPRLRGLNNFVLRRCFGPTHVPLTGEYHQTRPN